MQTHFLVDFNTMSLKHFYTYVILERNTWKKCTSKTESKTTLYLHLRKLYTIFIANACKENISVLLSYFSPERRHSLFEVFFSIQIIEP